MKTKCLGVAIALWISAVVPALALVPRGGDTSDMIKLRGHPDIIASDMTLYQLEDAATACFQNSRYALARFADVLTFQTRSALADSGIVALGYVPYSAWLVKIESLPTVSFLYNSGIRWIGELQPAYKLSTELSSATWGDWAIAGGGEIYVITTFHADIDVTTAESILFSAGIVEYGLFSQVSKLKYFHRIHPANLPDLADYSEVYWIDQVPAPVGPAMNSVRELVGADVVYDVPYNLQGSGIHVGMIEPTIAPVDHPDLQGRVYCEEGVCSHHAATVAGIMAAGGTTLYRGIAPIAVVLSRVFDGSIQEANPGDLEQDLLELIDGWDVGGAIRRADVVNFSLGYQPGSQPSGVYDELARLARIIHEC